MERGLQRADTKQWQYCLYAAYLPCNISLLSQCLHFPSTPLLLSLSLSLSSSGLIRAGLWGEGEMVTVTTAENDGQSGRALFVHVCVCWCACVWLEEAVLQYSLSYVYCAAYVPEGLIHNNVFKKLLQLTEYHFFCLKKLHWDGWSDVGLKKRRIPQQNTRYKTTKTSLHNWVGHPLNSLSIWRELGTQNRPTAPRCQEMTGSSEG